ncbi:MAG: hypothetical protein ACO1NX_02660 [Chitinophagaceae bacterium]
MQQNNRKQEFFTLDSRLTIQRGNIYQKKVKDNSEVGKYRFIVLSAYFLLVFLTVKKINEGGNSDIFFGIARIVFYVILFWQIFKNIYHTLFVKTWKSIIPLNDIKDVSTKPLDNGLETEVTLLISSGRKKFYTFRNAEGQLELFVDAVSAHISVPAQPAV